MSHSEQLFQDAQKILVGGVNSPVRAFKSVGGTPVFMSSAKGPYLHTADNQTLIDYVLSWGPMILGHADEDVIDAIQTTAALGTSFGAPSELETECAKQIQYFYPHMEKVRFVNSGTEATMSAIRLARGVTNKPLLVKFKGCYHGHSDSLLVAAGSGGLTFGSPDSAGVLDDTAKHTIVLDYNDTEAVTALFKEKGDQIAGVILEPITGNMGVITPTEAFLKALRTSCDEHGALLIFDEVMCGFRVTKGSASDLLGITPDITVLGKIIGGGLPCGAYGASAEIMAHLSPEGPVYQAGTLSGNPVVMAAGIATLKKLRDGSMFKKAENMTTYLCNGIQDILNDKGLPYVLRQVGTMFCLFFTSEDIQNCDDVCKCDMEKFSKFFHAMLDNGVYLPPSQFEACFMSAVHTEKDIEKSLKACKISIQ
jgi:glutamate-1-semialdehyde 2,1-aminomutase